MIYSKGKLKFLCKLQIITSMHLLHSDDVIFKFMYKVQWKVEKKEFLSCISTRIKSAIIFPSACTILVIAVLSQ